MALTFKRICRGAITNTSQPHGEELIPVDTNEPTSYIGRWDVSRTANDSVRAYLTGSKNNYELHFYGYGATKNNYRYASGGSYKYSAPYESYTSQIKIVVFHDGITDIGQLTLYDTTQNTSDTSAVSVTISDTVRVIQRFALNRVKASTLNLGKGIRHIHEGASFVNSTGVNITFPLSLQIADYASIQTVGDAFSWLNSHTEAGNYLIVGDEVLLWGKPTGTVWTIPEGVKSVCCGLWSNVASTTAVTLPSTTKYIAFGAFMNYTGLQKMKLPQGTEQIYGEAFHGCTNLTKIWIPRSVKGISTGGLGISTGEYNYGYYPFTGCSNLTIYCEIDSSDIPEGWSEYWNYIASGTQATVVWNTSEAAFDAL